MKRFSQNLPSLSLPSVEWGEGDVCFVLEAEVHPNWMFTTAAPLDWWILTITEMVGARRFYPKVINVTEDYAEELEKDFVRRAEKVAPWIMEIISFETLLLVFRTPPRDTHMKGIALSMVVHPIPPSSWDRLRSLRLGRPV